MYGNLKHAVEHDPIMLEPGLEEVDAPHFPGVPWHLVLLLSAEFTAFALLLTPLLPDTAQRASIEDFWLQHSLIALAAFGLYVLLTAPVAVGHVWLVQRWPLSLVAWLLMTVSVGAVVHILSVSTDPRGIFVGCISVSSFLLLVALLRVFECMRFDSWVPFVAAVFWPLLFFLPADLCELVSGKSAIGSPIASVVVAVFVLAELRLIEQGTLIGMGRGDLWRDPFSVSVWINCGTWRFLVQGVILLEKLLFHLTSFCARLLGRRWQCFVSTVFGCIPTAWWSPIHLSP
jgi:hypothetical protein